MRDSSAHDEGGVLETALSEAQRQIYTMFAASQSMKTAANLMRPVYTACYHHVFYALVAQW